MLKQLYNRWKRHQFQEHLKNEELKTLPQRKEFYSGFIKPGDLVFDIGANVGNRANVFLSLGAKVVAVEPQPYCIKQLVKRFGDKINLEAVGLGATEGKAELNVADVVTISSLSEKFIKETGKTRFANNKWEKKINIRLTTLDHLIARYGIPGFCKIDVEGYEPEVLKGLHQPLPCLSFEYCVPEMEDELLSTLKYINDLNPAGSYNYSAGESMELASTDWLRYNDLIQIVHSAQFTGSLFGDIYCKKN
jgi:FkbM family methyltransferase